MGVRLAEGAPGTLAKGNVLERQKKAEEKTETFLEVFNLVLTR